MDSDPVEAFEHHHGQLNALVLSVRALVADEASGAGLGPARLAALTALRDGLLEHFAREEEALFPFITEHLPDLVDRVERLRSAHDTVCGAVLRLAHVAEAGTGGLARTADLFERFTAAYASHARDEADLLEAVDRRLSSEQRKVLAELTEGL